jgi:hypothetical protein
VSVTGAAALVLDRIERNRAGAAVLWPALLRNLGRDRQAIYLRELCGMWGYLRGVDADDVDWEGLVRELRGHGMPLRPDATGLALPC